MIRSEVRYGSDNKSRVDFVLSDEAKQSLIYIEVKNTTWAKQTLALFPDTVTTRGKNTSKNLPTCCPPPPRPQSGHALFH